MRKGLIYRKGRLYTIQYVIYITILKLETTPANPFYAVNESEISVRGVPIFFSFVKRKIFYKKM